MDNIKKPIFVVGCGRSGTTIFFRTLAKHKELGYFSNYDIAFPRLLNLGINTFFLKANTHRRALLERIKVLNSVQETENIMRFINISEMGLPLTEKDYDEQKGNVLKKMIINCLKYHNVSRYVGKNTNNGMRIRFLDKIFPDSIFIHVLRDGRANANSYINVPFFYNIGIWWWNNRTYDEWLSQGNDPVELAALHWKHNVTEIMNQSKSLPKDRYLVIKYEDFNSDPEYFFKNAIEFCDLKWNKDFMSVLKNTKFENRNYKWKKNFNSKQVEIIESITKGLLKELGYE